MYAPAMKRGTARLQQQAGGEFTSVRMPLNLYRVYYVRPEEKFDLTHA